MAEDVTAAVDPRPFAVPQAKYPVVEGAGKEIDLLAAPHRGGRKIFIDAGLEGDVVLGEMRFRFPQAKVEIP